MFGYLMQQSFNGLTMGMIYGLSALGFSMVYKALNCLNFSHAENLMIGAMLTYTLNIVLQLPFLLSFLIVIVIMYFYGLLIERSIFRHFQFESKITFMLVSITLANVIRVVALLIWGPEPRRLPGMFGNTKLFIGELVLPLRNFYVFLIAVFFLFVLQMFLTKTKFGLAMRIAAENMETASLMGVKASQTRAATFAITAVLGGIAGILVAPFYNVSVELGGLMALKTFISAVIGGVGYLPGAIGGGLLLGLLESLISGYISSGYRDVIIFTFGIIVLGFRPLGLFRSSQKNKH